MHRLEPLSDPEGKISKQRLRQDAHVRHQGPQGAALDEFQNQEVARTGGGFRLAALERADHTGMGYLRAERGLSLEPPDGGFLKQQLGAKHLESDPRPRLGVGPVGHELGQEDASHAARAQFPDQAARADGVPQVTPMRGPFGLGGY